MTVRVATLVATLIVTVLVGVSSQSVEQKPVEPKLAPHLQGVYISTKGTCGYYDLEQIVCYGWKEHHAAGEDWKECNEACCKHAECEMAQFCPRGAGCDVKQQRHGCWLGGMNATECMPQAKGDGWISHRIQRKLKRKPRRDTKDWSRLVQQQDKELDDDEQEERERRKNENFNAYIQGTEHMSEEERQMRMMGIAKGAEAVMIFVTVLTDNRKATDELGVRFHTLLRDANGVDAKPYTVEDNQMLFNLKTYDGHLGTKLHAILLNFPEVVEILWGDQRTPGKAKVAYDAKTAKKGEDVTDQKSKATEKLGTGPASKSDAKDEV